MRDARLNTLAGLAALAFWSCTAAFSRSLTERLGTFTAAFAVYFGAGLLSLLLCAARPGRFRAMFELPRRYLGICGALFSLYMLVFYAALGWASDRPAAAAATIINYLWPALTLVFSIPILGQRARWTLWPGIALALCGIALALWQGGAQAGSWAHLRANGLPYFCALLAAVSWGLYSNLSKRLAGDAGGAVPLFMVCAGVLLGAARLCVSEESRWSAAAAGELAMVIVFPATLGYSLWDVGVRGGNLVLLAAASYFIPLAATVMISLYLGVPIGANVWLGCALVMAGAWVCKSSMTSPSSRAGSLTKCRFESFQ